MQCKMKSLQSLRRARLIKSRDWRTASRASLAIATNFDRESQEIPFSCTFKVKKNLKAG